MTPTQIKNWIAAMIADDEAWFARAHVLSFLSRIRAEVAGEPSLPCSSCGLPRLVASTLRFRKELVRA